MRSALAYAFLLIALLLPPSLPLSSVSGSEPLNMEGSLAVYIIPPTIIADGSEHNCIIVQLVDSEGRPLPAPHDITVFLASSNLDVGIILDETITIRRGEYLSTARFKSTLKPGETIIVATAQNLPPASAILKTFNPLVGVNPPNRLLVYASPPLMPAEAGAEGKVIVQLADSAGKPIIAFHSLIVTLTSSNTSVITAPQTIIIGAGSSYEVAYFRVEGKAGKATITALADGFVSGSTTVTVEEYGGAPAKLALTLSPPILLADGRVHECLSIQLLDARGRPSRAAEAIKVYVSSSDPEAADIIDREVAILPGKHYAVASIRTGYMGGSAVISAAAQDIEAASATINILSHAPSKLTLYASPQTILADGVSEAHVTVQVQTPKGEPAPSISDVLVRLTLQPEGAGKITDTITLRAGENYAVVKFASTQTPGNATITAIAQGFIASTATVKTIHLPVDLSILAPSTATVNQTYTITLLASSVGRPLINASVTWTVMGGEILESDKVTDHEGTARLVVKQTAQKLLVKASIYKPGYTPTETAKTIEVPPQLKPTPEPAISILGLNIPVSILALALAIAVSAMLAAYLYLKKKRY